MSLLHELASTLGASAQHREVVRILQLLLRKPIPARTHPLGMIYLELGQVESGQLRLNLWPDDVPRPQFKSIHDHPWHLTGHVIFGQLSNEEYSVVPASESGLRVLEAQYAPGSYNSTLRPSENRMIINSTEVREVKAGDNYHLQRRRFHYTVIKANLLAATVIFRYDSDNNPPRILEAEPHASSKSGPYRREHCDWNLVQQYLRRIKLQ